MQATDPHRQQDLYWKQLIELKVAQCYIRQYRDSLTKWVKGFGTLKAVASSAGIGAWVIWREYAFVWGTIIAMSQVADALRDVFPFNRHHRLASEHAIMLDSIFINAQLEWENIFAGRVTDREITNRYHKLMMLQHEAESKNFPDGLPTKRKLFALAQEEASVYFTIRYDVTVTR